MIQLFVLWMAKRKLAHKRPLEEPEKAAAAFLKKHVFSKTYIVDDDDCRVCEYDKTWFHGIMMRIPPWLYMASGSFSYDFNVAFDVIFCRAIVGAYFKNSSAFKGLLTLWSIVSTSMGLLFWFYRWKSPASFIHRTVVVQADREDGGRPKYTHYSIDVGGKITNHMDREDSFSGNFHSTCQYVTLLAFDEASQIIISILSLTLLGSVSDWPGSIEWLNIASSICGFLWYFYSGVSENRYWGVHVMAGPFEQNPQQRVIPTSRTLNVIDGLFDSVGGDIESGNVCHECESKDAKSESDSELCLSSKRRDSKESADTECDLTGESDFSHDIATIDEGYSEEEHEA